MPHLRVQVSIANRSNVPADAFVNTFHFNSSIGKPDGSINSAIASFYNDVHSPGTQSIGSFLSNAASRQANSLTVKQYDMADAEPREPSVVHYALDDAPPSDGYPDEVALCLSFYADRNIAKHRGRVFIGPLGTNAGTLDLTSGDCRPVLALQQAIEGAAKFLMNPVGAGGIGWSVWSNVDHVLRPVTNGWVDNAFDTQRRRGVRTTSRRSW